jgi:hypothetical protein
MPRYPVPQPRVVYVPASSTSWAPDGAALPATTPAAALPAAAASQPASEPKAAAPLQRDPLLLHEADPEQLQKADTNAKVVKARTMSFGKERAEIISGPLLPAVEPSDACPGEACPAPLHHGHHDCDPHAIWLPCGGWNLQVRAGHYWDIDAADYNWVPISLRAGHVCCGGKHGAWEPIFDLTSGLVVNSEFGDWFIGPSFILRYNLVQPGTRFVPYVQGGVGFQYNDAYRDANSTAGSRIELTGQAQCGFRIFLCKNWSLDFEGGYQHISNFNMSDRDEGFNALGATLGFSYFFPCGRHH